MSRHYVGETTGDMDWIAFVRNDGDLANGPFRTPLAPRTDLVNHSPDGFAWGYEGSGPAQLALAILADATGDDQLALTHYQDYKRKVVAVLDKDRNWEISQADVLDWLTANVAEFQARRRVDLAWEGGDVEVHR